MGFLKERQFEQDELGYRLDPAQEHLGVCPGCIADEGLRRHVTRLAQIVRCDFCDGGGPQGLALGSLFRYMAYCIAAEWDLAIHELSYGEGEHVWEAAGATVYDGADLLAELGDPLANEELAEAFVAAFENDRVRLNAFRPAHHERLVYGWEAFARFVKEESRFLFLRTGSGPQGDEELIAPAQLLDEVAMAIENGGLIRQVPAGSQLVRARQHAPGETLTTPAELGSPLPHYTVATRMSPPGIAMFYGAEDAETALTELHLDALPRLATVGAWTTARPLRYLDLVDVDVPSLFDPLGKVQRPWRLFLKRFANKVSEPPSPAGEAVDYVPTQVFTEYVRHVLGDRDNPVRGIRYRSAVRPQGVCWVLFVDAGGCTEVGPDWEQEPGHWLGLELSSLRRFQAGAAWAEAT